MISQKKVWIDIWWRLVLFSPKKEENERLQAKIDGLKQEYEKIGLQVQNLITFFHTFFTKWKQNGILCHSPADVWGYNFTAAEKFFEIIEITPF